MPSINAAALRSIRIENRPVDDKSPRIIAPTLSAVPKGDYAGGQSPGAGTHNATGSAAICVFSDGSEPAPQRARRLFDETIAGAGPDTCGDEMMSLQAFALNQVQALFDNKFGSDGEIKHQVGLKQASYTNEAPTDVVAGALYGGRKTTDQQADALNFIVRTFQGSGDQALRMAAMNKLGEVGRRRDIDALMPLVRKGTSADIFHGLEAIKAITRRRGSTQERSVLMKDKKIGPLLRKSSLTGNERTRAIEAVLSRGEVKSMKRHGGTNRNEVWFVTFKDTLPGPNGQREQIRGVFKPEKCWPGKDRAYFSREVASYEFDRRFAKTDTVPPTVEALIGVPGSDGCELGSMQWMVEGSQPLGKDVLHYDPKFDGLRKTPEYEAQMAKIRTLLYILGDPDKLANNVHKTPNLQNIMVDQHGKLWMIDNSYNLGAAPLPDAGLLPKKPDPTTTGQIKSASHDDVRHSMESYISSGDAGGVTFRMGDAGFKLDQRLHGH